jgi:flavin-dependent dehydrogenase
VFRTRVLVGADGVHSQVRRKLFPGRKVRTVPAIEALVTPRPEILDLLRTRALIDFGGIEGGYGWIFPKRDHLNVGLYRLFKTRHNLDLKQSLVGYIEENPLLRDGKIGEVRGFEIPIQAVSPRLVQGGALLVGDAAGLGEAFYGEGIYFAVRSGCKAGEFIASHLQRGDRLEQYSRWASVLRRDLFASRLTASLFYRMPGFGFDRMVRNPFVNDLFTGVVTGEVSPWKCLALSLATVPYWILQARSPTTMLPGLDA